MCECCFVGYHPSDVYIAAAVADAMCAFSTAAESVRAVATPCVLLCIL